MTQKNPKAEATQNTEAEQATPEKTLAQLLREKREEIGAARKGFDKRRLELNEIRKTGQSASLQQRNKVVNEKKAIADQQKEQHKKLFDDARAQAVRTYEETVKAATVRRDDDIKSAHTMKERVYQNVNTTFEQECAPFVDVHKAESRKIDEDFAAEMDKVNSEEGKAVTVLSEEVRKLENLVAKPAQELQAKKPQPPQRGKHDHVKPNRDQKKAPEQKAKQPAPA